MAEDQKPDRSESESAAAEPPVSHPHDKYFYSVFSDTRNAADLLRPYLPQEVARTLRWSSLTHVPGCFVDGFDAVALHVEYVLVHAPLGK